MGTAATKTIFSEPEQCDQSVPPRDAVTVSPLSGGAVVEVVGGTESMVVGEVAIVVSVTCTGRVSVVGADSAVSAASGRVVGVSGRGPAAPAPVTGGVDAQVVVPVPRPGAGTELDAEVAPGAAGARGGRTVVAVSAWSIALRESAATLGSTTPRAT